MTGGGLDGISLTASPDNGNPFDEKENIAIRAAASTTNTAADVDKANDGTVANDNYWNSGSLTPELILDFKVPVKFNYVVIRSRSAAAPDTTIQDFRIDAWDATENGGSGDWDTVFTHASPGDSTIKGDSTASNAYYGFPIDAIQDSSKLRLTVSRGKINGGVNFVMLFEIQVYLVPDRESAAETLAEGKTCLQNTTQAANGNNVLVTEKWATSGDYSTFQVLVNTLNNAHAAFDTTSTALTEAKNAVDSAIGSFGTFGLKMVKPLADVVSVQKTASNDTSATFTLSNASAYSAGFSNLAWAVYDEEFGGSVVAGITASLAGDDLTLSTGGGAIMAEQYWVQVSADSQQPSDRLGLTVTSVSGITAQPVFSSRLVLKESTSTTVTFTLDNGTDYTGILAWAVYTDTSGTAASGVSASLTGSTLTLSHATDVASGNYWVSVDMDSAGESELAKITVAAPLKLVRAAITDAERTKLTVTFAEAVSAVDIAKFQVKVNTKPNFNYSTVSNGTVPWLDHSMDTPRTITAASGSGATWDLTMSEAAQYGEIIRLATLSNGGASSAGAVLPKVPGLIVKNEVKRTKYSFEDTAGLYKVDASGSMTQPSGFGAKTFSNMLSNISTTGDGETLVLVLGANDNFAGDSSWKSAGYANGAGKLTIIITSTDTTQRKVTKNGADWLLAVNNSEGITLILDNVELVNGASSSQFFIANYKGRIILDNGAKITNTGSYTINRSAAYGTMFFIMNDGHITSTSQQNAGPVVLGANSVFVMHGGSITGNATNSTANAVKTGAVGVASSHSSSTNINATIHGSVGFYMTGGEISGNSAAVSGESGAGGVLMAGEFQKTGGVIQNNSVSGSANNTSANILVMKVAGANPATPEDRNIKKTSASDADDTLFIDCVKPANDTAGTLSIPSWGASSWDAP
jgi:hypothetical protein